MSMYVTSMIDDFGRIRNDKISPKWGICVALELLNIFSIFDYGKLHRAWFIIFI